MSYYSIDWVVRGSSVVEIPDYDIADAGLDPDDFADPAEFVRQMDAWYDYDLLREAVDNFSERDRPEVTSALEED